MTHSIYHLIGGDGRVYYVGATSRPALRFQLHLAAARSFRRRTAVNVWLAAELRAGRIPTFKVVQRVRKEWRSVERAELRRQIESRQPIKNGQLPRGMTVYKEADAPHQILSQYAA